MRVDEAVELFWEVVEGSSIRRVAKDVGVGHTTAAAWKDGTLPEGRNRELLLDWAHRQLQQRPPAPDAITAAILATGENVKRLAQIQGYAQFVLDQLVDTVKRQQLVVDSLSPWADAEGRQIALNMEKAAAAEAALRRAVPPIDAVPGAPAVPTAKKKASGGK